MANKRIYNLTDTQAAYDPDIYLAVDDATFTNTKKLPISVVYPKTNTLSAVGDYNPTTLLLRTDNGSGSENKVTVKDLLEDSDTVAIIFAALGLTSTDLTFDDTGNWADFNITSVNGKKSGNVIHVTADFSSANSSTTPELLTKINGYVSPGHVYWFVGQMEETTNVEGAYGYVDTNGNIYFKPGKGSNQVWHFGISIVMGNS